MDQAKSILRAAERFRRAYITLDRVIGTRMDMALAEPMIVYQAFSTELYLKFLVLKRTGKPSWGHNLAKLYGALPEFDKEEVKKFWDTDPFRKRTVALIEQQHGIKFTKTFEEYLASAADDFQKFRYYFEYPPPEGPVHPGTIGEAVRNHIYTLYSTEYTDIRLKLPDGVSPAHEVTPVHQGARIPDM